MSKTTRPRHFSRGQIIELSIDSTSFNGGRGVGRLDGFVFFVPFTAPGDTVSVKITLVKKNYGEAKIIKILEPSPHRTDPLCRYFSDCGGCQLQHLNYEIQVIEKTKILNQALQKGLKLQGPLVSHFYESPKKFGYRKRIQIHNINGTLGFLKAKSKELIPIDHCPIADPKVSDQIQKIKPSHPKIEILLTTKGEILSYPVQQKPKEAHFSQVNSEVNNLIVEKVVETVTRANPQSLLELYCGSGNYTLSIAHKHPDVEILGVELSQTLVTQAQLNAKIYKNVSFVSSCVTAFLEKSLNKSFEFLILNPPRTGAHEKVIKSIKKLKPNNIVYVSCNPSTLARDLSFLMNTYSIKSIYGYDMFPQTAHLESFVHLKLNN